MKCGDCKHWFDNGTDYCSCDRDALLRERNFFCAAWERKKPFERPKTNADREVLARNDGYVLKSSVLNAIHSGDIDMGMVTPHEYRLLRRLSEKIDKKIQSVHAADVAPVRHGRWLWDDEGYHCSECWYHTDNATPWCPVCGARIDGGKK